MAISSADPRLARARALRKPQRARALQELPARGRLSDAQPDAEGPRRHRGDPRPDHPRRPDRARALGQGRSGRLSRLQARKRAVRLARRPGFYRTFRNGGAYRDRTGKLYNAIVTPSKLSQGPVPFRQITQGDAIGTQPLPARA